MLAIAAARALVPAGATAGTYEVLSCEAAPGNVNNAWTSANTQPSHLTVSTVCPRGDDYGGLRAFDTLGALNAPDGARGEWRFDAPAGTVISEWRYKRWVGKEGTNSWSVYVRRGDGSTIETCTIVLPADECWVGGPTAGEHLADGDSTTRLILGFTCANPSANCSVGATRHAVWASLYSSRITLEENTLPTVGAPSGALVAGGWRRGSEAVSFTASDGSPGVGIKETRIYVDGQLLASNTVARSCDYTLPVPCTDPAGAVAHTVDTTQLADGERQLEVAAVDAAGNERRAAPVEVQVDNNAPSTLTGLATSSEQSNPSLPVNWSGNDGTGSGATTYDIEVSINGGAFQPWLTGTTATSGTYTATAGNRYRFRARSHDASGLTGAYSGPTHEVYVYTPLPPAGGGIGVGGSTPPPSGDPPTGGDPTPPTSDGPPTTQPRSTLRLRLRSARVRGTRLVLAAITSRAATGTATLTYSARVRGRTLQSRRTLRVDEGRIVGTLRLSRTLAAAARGRLELRYTGDERYRPRTVRLTLTP